uniref:Endonuclease/exonuclease/phosphatase domain-containing protein n=1 Tax=Macaca fascicularis TaxID=9541 RepID=A0A7N9D1F5_MACFA
MSGISPHLLIIILNVKWIKYPIKRNWLNEFKQQQNKQKQNKQKQKQDPIICCLQETHLICKDIHRLKVKGWKEIFHTNGNQKQAGIAIFTSAKTDFKSKAIKRDKGGHYIVIKGSNQEAITIVNIHAPKTSTPIFIKKILLDLKEETDANTITVGDFNPNSALEKSSRQKINKETSDKP